MKASKGDVRAAEVLLDRAYGKAKQTMDVSVSKKNLPEWLNEEDNEK
jgi:replication initiation and membrane attachment protein DnaB